MKLFNLWLSSLLLGLITITTIAQSREYHVKDSRSVSYMYRKFDDVKEKIFPADIRINVSLSRSVGTLLYSIDKNMNQLIVSLHDGITYVIKVELNKLEIIWSLPELCGCERCRYEIMDLRIQLNTHITIRCNGGNIFRVRIMNKKELNENYPILYTRMNTNRTSTNEAHLWLVNTPQYEKVYPNNQQMYGCIFKVSYMDKPIYSTNTTSDITHPCIKKCSINVCNGGQCLEAYNDYPVCNCTTRFLNGRYCNESIRPMNLRSSNQLFIFDMIKLSWNSSVNTIFTLNNSNVRITLKIVKENLLFELKYLKKNNIKDILSINYVHDNSSIFIAYFKEKMIDIWLFNNGFWSNGQILSEYDLRREIFDSLTLQSVNGNISLYTKSNDEYIWRRVIIFHPIEINNDTISGNARYVTVDNSDNISGYDKNVGVNNSGPSKNGMILLVLGSILIIIGLIIGMVIFLLRKKKKYSKSKDSISGNDIKPLITVDDTGNSHESSYNIREKHKDDKKKEFGRKKNSKDMSQSPLYHLFTKEYEDYTKLCKSEIGCDVNKKIGTDFIQWNSFLVKKIRIDAISNIRLKRMYDVMKYITREDTYLSDIILLLIYTRIFKFPSMSAVPNKHRSIQYLAAHLSDKYNHQKELQGLSEQVIECMMDFLEDLSPYNDTDNIFNKLLDEMLAFVGYNIVINKDNYKYQNKRNVTFLEDYSKEDNLERLWSAVIMYAHTRDPKHITMMKKHLNANVIQGEILSKDMIIIALATPRLCPVHNFDESMLTNTDYLLIVDIEKYKILSNENIQIFTVNIINIFNHKYKEEIIQRMKDNSDLNIEHKMAIKCLRASLLKGLINENKQMMLMSLLDEFYLNDANNNEADQIMQSVLNHLLEHKHYQNEKINNKLYNLCIKYFNDEKISEGIKLPSSLIICYIATNMINMPSINDVIDYLSVVNVQMIKRKSVSIDLIDLSNYTLHITEIERVLSLITPEQDKPKNQ